MNMNLAATPSGPPSTWFEGFEKRQFNVNGVVVCARLSANWLNQMDKPVLVLLHGFGASLQTWDAWAGELEKDRRVLRFDVPGFGLTGPARDGVYSAERMIKVLSLLLDYLGVSKASLAGNSLGGYIALLAPTVRNQGVVVAKLGTVAMAAGETFNLQIEGGSKLVGLEVRASTIASLVDNGLAVQAPGGLIILSAQAMQQVQGGEDLVRGSTNLSMLPL